MLGATGAPIAITKKACKPRLSSLSGDFMVQRLILLPINSEGVFQDHGFENSSYPCDQSPRPISRTT